MIRKVQAKSIQSIAEEWDAIADLRNKQILEGRDISYEYVLVPQIIELTNGCDISSVVDAGCGVGFLTQKLGMICDSIVAVDISEKSLSFAKENCKKLQNVNFLKGYIEDIAEQCGQPKYTLAIANMTLMTTMGLTRFLHSIHNLVIPGGRFIATLTHPCFWPIYWDYISEEWFDYSEEIFIEAPFKISNESSELYTTHVHRPIQKYFDAIVACGFEIETVREPVPIESIQSKYNTKWKFPRFIAFRCIRK